MSQNVLDLKWDYFDKNLEITLEDLFTKDSFTNVTLVSDELTLFRAHKLVLAASSPIFKDLLMKNPHSHPTIYLRGVDRYELDSILHFIYHGST